jgi:hypothetical protein
MNWQVILFVLSLISPVLVQAQSAPCATMENHEAHLNSDPSLRAAFEATQRAIAEAQQVESQKTSSNVVTIPVVVHVVHSGQAYGVDENIPVEQIMSQLDVLNRDFRRKNADSVDLPVQFAGLGGDTEVEFCLARFDPTGYPTSGIKRYQYGQTNWDRPDIETILKPQTIWDRDKYLNIWIVRFGGDLANLSVQGYAQFPGMAANTDGVVISYRAFGTTGNVAPSLNEGRTTVHEIGHWLGLFHIWGDDQDDPVQDQCLGDDQVGDTPNQQTEYYLCPNWPQSSCSSFDMYMNYMDYTDGSCQNIFTKGQCDRMRATLNTDRSSILNAATACDYTFDVFLQDILVPGNLDTLCSSTFSPVILVGNSAETIISSFDVYVTVSGSAPTQTSFQGGIAPGDTFELVLEPITVPDGAYSINITLGNINGQPYDQFPPNDFKTNQFWVVNGGTGTALPYQEGFESGIPMSWTIENPDNDRTWTQANVGGFGQSSKSIRFDNFDRNSGDPTGTTDAFILDPLDFSSARWQQLEFDLAYARRDATSEDSLIVLISTNCGGDWERLWANGGQGMATSPDYTFPFTPASSGWSSNFIDLNAYTGQGQTWIRFEHKSDGGNNLYVDNINLRQATTGLGPIANTSLLTIFPNPAQTVINISGLETFDQPNFVLFNYLGEEIISGPADKQINLPKGISSGVYVLLVYDGELTEKYLIQIQQ